MKGRYLMRRRATVVSFAILLALVSSSALALAGGWAVTTVEGVPDDVVAGTTYTIDYTIRQHGQHPADVDNTYIQIMNGASGETLRFQGQPAGEPGAYIAEVTFPAEGAWQWQVEQGIFGPQTLGSFQVQTPSAAASFWTSTAVRAGLPLAALVALGLLAMQFNWSLRERRGAAPALQPLRGETSGD
jgi:hypothetical protein